MTSNNYYLVFDHKKGIAAYLQGKSTMQKSLYYFRKIVLIIAVLYQIVFWFEVQSYPDSELVYFFLAGEAYALTLLNGLMQKMYFLSLWNDQDKKKITAFWMIANMFCFIGVFVGLMVHRYCSEVVFDSVGSVFFIASMVSFFALAIMGYNAKKRYEKENSVSLSAFLRRENIALTCLTIANVALVFVSLGAWLIDGIGLSAVCLLLYLDFTAKAKHYKAYQDNEGESNRVTLIFLSLTLFCLLLGDIFLFFVDNQVVNIIGSVLFLCGLALVFLGGFAQWFCMAVPTKSKDQME